MATTKKKRSEANKTLFQTFEYYLPDPKDFENPDNQDVRDRYPDFDPQEEHHWIKLKHLVPELKKMRITSVWLPPAYKSWGMADSVGYAVYDKYDLGEFDQQGRTLTKYGSKDEYLECIDAMHSAPYAIKVYPDIVMNHMMGGEWSHKTTVYECDPDNRLNPYKIEHKDFEVYTDFTFPGRNGAYANDIWTEKNFSGCDMYNHVYLFQDKKWADDVDWERGNFDLLMGNNLDMSYPDTKTKLIEWGKWYLDMTNADGFRVDAVKHISARFLREWLNELTLHLEQKRGKGSAKDFFVVGEYWADGRDQNLIEHYLDMVNQEEAIDENGTTLEEISSDDVEEVQISAFDVQLHANLAKCSNMGYEYDMNNLFNDSLLASRRENAVTFVDNHDSQLGEQLQPQVQPWFKQQAYALIMFQQYGIPCVFYGDLYGIRASYYWKKMKDQNGNEIKVREYYPTDQDYRAPVKGLKRMCRVRYSCAHGGLTPYYGPHNRKTDENGDTVAENLVHAQNVIGYTRSGGGYKYGGVAVLVSNRGKDHDADYANVHRYMLIKENKSSEPGYNDFIDILHPNNPMVTLNEHGYGHFYVEKGGAAVWIRKLAYDEFMKDEVFANDL